MEIDFKRINRGYIVIFFVRKSGKIYCYYSAKSSQKNKQIVLSVEF